MGKVKPKVLGTVEKSHRPKDPLAGFLDPADAIVPCRVCGAAEGEPCKITEPAKASPSLKRSMRAFGVPMPRRGTVHFSRRFNRLLLTVKKPHLRAEFEKQAVEMLRDFLKEKAT